jgi:hypothetical protein
MRNASVDDERDQSLRAAAMKVEGGSPEDKTTTVSVATLRRLRRLSARSARDRADESTGTPDPDHDAAPPSFFAKSGAVLVIPEPESGPFGSHREEPGSEPTLLSRASPTRSGFRPKANALLPDSERPGGTNRASARSSTGRLLIFGLFALLVSVLVGASWTGNVGGVRERVAARAPAVKALVDRGLALLSE